MSKVVIYSDEDVEFSFEDAGEGIALLHCTAKTVSVSKLKKWFAVFSYSKEIMKNNGFEKFMTISPNDKFCKIFGGTYVGEYEEYGVYVWDLK